ncbi:MAG TPA: hypothetical protein VLV54_04710 [Thermoanaerobaculia bacterium]|nr:hypothetical protein [Thermoanaerobaculia bacterium]
MTEPHRPNRPDRIAFHATATVKRADFGMTSHLLAEEDDSASRIFEI